METDQRHTKTRKSSPKIHCAQILVEIDMAESARECDPNAKLMSEFQVYDCLYNKYSRDFKDKYKKMRAKTIAQKIQHNNHGGQRQEKTRKSFMETRLKITPDTAFSLSFVLRKLEKTRKD